MHIPTYMHLFVHLSSPKPVHLQQYPGAFVSRVPHLTGGHPLIPLNVLTPTIPEH